MDSLNLDMDSVMFMKVLTQTECPSEEEDGQQNGFCPPTPEDSGSDTPIKPQRDPLCLEIKCPVGLHKSALLYPSPMIIYNRNNFNVIYF